jgi:hypothetical protein
MVRLGTDGGSAWRWDDSWAVGDEPLDFSGPSFRCGSQIRRKNSSSCYTSTANTYGVTCIR